MTCRYCNKPLGFLQRVSGQHYCSAAHQKAHVQEQEQAAIERLRHMAVTAPQADTKPEAKPPEPEPRPAPPAPSPAAEVPPPIRSDPPRPAEPPPPKVTSTPLPAPPMQKPVTPVAAAGQALPSTEEIPLPAFLTKGRKRDAPKARKPIDRASIDDLDDVPLPSFMVRGAKAKAKSGPDEPAPESPAVPIDAPAGATVSQSRRDDANSGTDEIQVPASVSKRRRAMDAAKPVPAEPVVEAQSPAKEAEEPPAAPTVVPVTLAPEIVAEGEVPAPEVPHVVAEAPVPETELEPVPIMEPPVPAEAVQVLEPMPEPEPVAEPAPEFERYVLPKLSPLAWDSPSGAAPAEAVAWAGYRGEPTAFVDRPIHLPAATLSPLGRIPEAPPVTAIPFQPALTAFRPGSVQPAAAPSIVHEQPANMALLVPVGPDVEPLLQAPQQAINLPHVREGRPMQVPVEPLAGTAEAAQPVGSLRVAAIKHLEIKSTAPASLGEVAELDMAGPLAEEIPGVAIAPVVGESSGSLLGQLDTRTPSTELAALPANPELTAVGWLPLQAAAATAATTPSEESGALRGMGAQPLVGSGTVMSEPDPRALSEMFARPEQRRSVFDADALAVSGSAEPRKDSWTSFPARPCQVPDMTFEPVAVQLALEVTAEAQAPPRPMRSRFRKPVPLHLSGRDVPSLPKLVPVGCDFRSAPLARANLS